MEADGGALFPSEGGKRDAVSSNFIETETKKENKNRELYELNDQIGLYCDVLRPGNMSEPSFHCVIVVAASCLSLNIQWCF